MRILSKLRPFGPRFLPLLFSLSLAAGGLAGANSAMPSPADAPEAAASGSGGSPPAASAANHVAKRGVVVDFEARPADGVIGKELLEGRLAELRFRITEAATGAPVSGIVPGAWLDIGEVIQGQPGAQQKSCKEKIALYLKGVVGIRPMIDLNSYYVVVMNKEASLSVVDPLVSMVGKTSTLATIPLTGAGGDWARSADEKRLYVSMPKAGQVAVVDTDAFKVSANIVAGTRPTRTALQPDGRYLWVGNDAGDAQASGVTVIDTDTLAPVGHLFTGAGHHEIAFSADSRYAFVSNRDGGTVTLIDVGQLRVVKQLATGPLPISLAYSPLAGALYVADGKAGMVTVVSGDDFDQVKEIRLQPGLGPLRVSPDGRWVLVVNPAHDRVAVIDAASNEVPHQIEIAGQPYQVIFSRAFAYVRPLASERVHMVRLDSLGAGSEPIVQGFQAGSVAPRLAGDLPIADSVAPTSSEAAVFIVNPADNTTYFYMEGMNAPASNYQVYGARARAVIVVDRSLKEIEPGVYASKVKIPVAGRYDVAFLLDTPRLMHCFSAEARPNPLIERTAAAVALEYLAEDRRVEAGPSVPLRLRLTDPATGRPISGLEDVRVLAFRTPGRDRVEVPARAEGDGVYRALLPLRRPGAYYVYVAIRSKGIGYADLPYLTLVAAAGGTVAANAPAGAQP